MHRNAARLAFTRAVNDSGLLGGEHRRLRFHDLRHTFASHLIIDIRLDVAQVSRILGHARTTTTITAHPHAVRMRPDYPQLLLDENLPTP